MSGIRFSTVLRITIPRSTTLVLSPRLFVVLEKVVTIMELSDASSKKARNVAFRSQERSGRLRCAAENCAQHCVVWGRAERPFSKIRVFEPPLVGGPSWKADARRQIRYRLTGTLLIVHACHCCWCQRETSTAHALNALYEYLANAEKCQQYADAADTSGTKRLYEELARQWLHLETDVPQQLAPRKLRPRDPQ